MRSRRLQPLFLTLFITALLATPMTAQNSVPSDHQREGGAKEVLMSLVLPGSGEFLMGRTGLAKVFLGAEVTLWAGLFASKKYVDVLQNDLEAYAATYAGVISTGKNEQYWIDIGTAQSIYEYNELKLLERQLDRTYPEAEGFDWIWDSEENRDEYVRQRFNRLDWKRSSTFVISGLVLNRLVSAIDVIRLIRKDRAASAERQSLLNFDYVNDAIGGETMRLNFTWLIR